LSALTLEEDGIREDTKENLEKIYNAGTTLLSTVNDILDISKIESGKFELVPTEYDTPSLINDTITQSIMRKGEKPVEFVLDIDENIPSRLYGDDLRIKQILNNLLSNAFKYTKEGTVTLSIRSEFLPSQSFEGSGELLPMDNEFRASGRGSKTGVLLCFSVRDTGIGISPEDIERLFTEYVQVDTKLNHEIEGTGLGLSIAKMMVDMMGGSITVESEYGKGSVFAVTLPQRIVSATVIGAELVNSIRNFHYSVKRLDKDQRTSRIKLPYAQVLLVDDVMTNIDVARGMMKPYGMLIDYVLSGQEAIDAVREEKVRYNAIFMDHMMPGIDGVEATRIIREEIGTKYAITVPIIALTANAILGNEEMFLSRGFQAYIPKPIQMTLLDSVINKWVRDVELEKSLANQQAAVTGDTGQDSLFGAGIAGLDFEMGLNRFSGDMETYIQVLQSFAMNTRLQLEAVKKGSEGKLADYAINVHGIKGSCRGICAEAAGDQAEALEKAAKAGDLNFVTVNNPALITTISKLIADIEETLSKNAPKKDRPKKNKPDLETLSKLREACEKYKINDIEAAMEEIENFDYESDGGLALWLRDNVIEMNYAQIAERLKSIPASFR
jgi:CheY-like chemotaxis protein/two-component sensor histidine kinase